MPRSSTSRASGGRPQRSRVPKDPGDFPKFTSTNVVGIQALKSTPLIAMMARHGVEAVDLMPEPSNSYDPNAIMVTAHVPAGQVRIGYLPNPPECAECGKTFKNPLPEVCECGSPDIIRDGLASRVKAAMEVGIRFFCPIQEYLGMTADKPTAGLRIKLIRCDPPEAA